MKKKLGFSIELSLVEKLDQYRKETRRTRSQAVETLIDECSLDNTRLIKEQGAKIKELESELILAKSDNVVLPEIDGELIEECSRLKKQIEAKDDLIRRLQAKLVNMGDAISGLHEQSQREVYKHARSLGVLLELKRKE